MSSIDFVGMTDEEVTKTCGLNPALWAEAICQNFEAMGACLGRELMVHWIAQIIGAIRVEPDQYAYNTGFIDGESGHPEIVPEEFKVNAFRESEYRAGYAAGVQSPHAVIKQKAA